MPAFGRQVSNGTGISVYSTRRILKRLIGYKIVVCDHFLEYNRNYHTLVDEFPYEKAVQKYLVYLAKHRLYKNIPFEPITETDLRTYPQFVSDCHYCGISVDEGIEAIKRNRVDELSVDISVNPSQFVFQRIQPPVMRCSGCGSTEFGFVKDPINPSVNYSIYSCRVCGKNKKGKKA